MTIERMTINSKKLGIEIDFTLVTARNGTAQFVYADISGRQAKPGTLGIQIGQATPGNWKRIARNWYRAYVRNQ